MSHELAVFDRPEEPLIARSSEVPAEFALQGFEGVHALVADPARSETLLREMLGFAELADHDWQARGEHRGGRILFEHIDDARDSRRRAPCITSPGRSIAPSRSSGASGSIAVGLHPTPVIDRFYFESVYFREPSGILYELASFDGAGFDVDEPAETLGETLALPPNYRADPQQDRTDADPAAGRPPTGAPPRRARRASGESLALTRSTLNSSRSHMSKMPTAPTSCPYVVGDDGLASWSDTHADAWIGLLETHKQLTRALDAELEARHGLSLSSLELLGRLAAADDHQLQALHARARSRTQPQPRLADRRSA